MCKWGILVVGFSGQIIFTNVNIFIQSDLQNICFTFELFVKQRKTKTIQNYFKMFPVNKHKHSKHKQVFKQVKFKL